MEEEMKIELANLQAQMALAIEEGDVALAYEIETEIDELQNKIIRLQS